MRWPGQPTPLLGLSLGAAGASPHATCHRGVTPAILMCTPSGFATLWEPVSCVPAAAMGVGSCWGSPGGKLRQGRG